MYVTIKHKYGEAEAYAKPVVSQLFPKNIFMGHIREAVEKLYTRSRTILNNHRMWANILEHYLNKYGINEVCPDEDFIKQMWDRLKENGELNGREYKWMTRKKVPRFTRKVINEYFYPNGLVQRDVIREIVIQRYEKFLNLTKNSQDAIKWFEENGKRVEAIPVFIENGQGGGIDPYNQVIRMLHRVTKRELLPVTKSGKIEHAIRFLNDVNKKGFEEATDEDVKKFEELCTQRGVRQIDDYMAHVATFFINIHSKGFIKYNPFAHVSLKMNGGAVKKDFLTIEGMEKLRDLSTLDIKNKDDVRDRLMVLLNYDLALRISELLALEISDFRKDTQGEWFVTLRPEIQKGHKDEEIMYFFFDETKKLIEVYLKTIRKQFRPVVDNLIISNQGGRVLSPQHCSKRFKELCDKFGIKTYYGGSPSPHVLRHSFATLNIEPIGLALPLYEMIQRLRHSKVETTRRHYIHNNPYLKKIKHEVLRKNNRTKTTADILNEMPLAEVEHWLSDKLGVDSATIRLIRGNHKKVFSESQIDKKDIDNRMYISEEESLERLKDLEISEFSLRQYAIKKGAVAEGCKGSPRHGQGFRYREDFIEDLAKNWVSGEHLRKKLNITHMHFYRTIRREKWRSLKIGNIRYIHKLDCV